MKKTGIVAGILFLLCHWAMGQDCETTLVLEEVRGTSMPGIAENGETVKVSMGYYRCNPVQRKDVAVVKWAGNKVPLLKRIVGMPGDRMKLIRGERGNHLLINGDTLKTSRDQAYYFGTKESRMFGVYLNSYRGIIPEDAFIILGNRPEGTLDSSRFGMVGRDMLVGKMID